MISLVHPSAPRVAVLRCALRVTWLLTGLGGFPTAVPAQQPAAASGGSDYHLAARWKAGGEGDWNQLTLDSQAHRLYAARTGSVQVIDTERGALVREIPGLDDAHGVVPAPDLNRGFATSGGSDAVLVFDLTSLRPAGAPIAVGQQPDAIVYEPLTRHVFVFNDGSHDTSVIDAATDTVVARIALGGAPGPAAADGGGTLFGVLRDKNEVLAIDAQKNKVVQRWPLAPGAEPTGLALDPIRHRVFVGCRNGQIIVLDTPSGRHLAELSTGQEVNACAVDPGTGGLFAAGGDGTLLVVREDPAKPGTFRVAETVKTPGRTKALAFDPRTQAVYLAAANSEAAPAAPDEKPRLSGMAPGGFVLLKFTH